MTLSISTSSQVPLTIASLFYFIDEQLQTHKSFWKEILIEFHKTP